MRKVDRREGDSLVGGEIERRRAAQEDNRAVAEDEEERERGEGKRREQGCEKRMKMMRIIAQRRDGREGGALTLSWTERRRSPT
jgi:hypothetical protein